MEQLLRVLIIEDSEEDTQLLLRELQRGGYEVEFERVESAGAMQSALSQKNWDLILSDYSLPTFSAPKALEVLKASSLDLPFIIVSGTIGEEIAVAALKAGANDFLVKGKFARLGPAIERELRETEIHRDRKQVEEQIKYHARLLRHINDAVIATDDRFRITAWNRAAERIYGWTASEVIGRSADEILTSGLSEEQRAEAQDLLKENSSFRSERIHSKKNGQLVYVEENTIALTDQSGMITGYVSVNRDISERKQAEEALRENERLLSEAQSIGHVGSWSYNLVTNSLQYSDEMYRLLDVSPKEFPHTIESFLNLIYPLDHPEAVQWMEAIRTGRQPSELNFRIFRKNGELRHIQCRGALTFDSSGKPVRFTGMAQDITERKRAEEAVQQYASELERRVEERTLELTHANRAKDEFLANMSHELRTPLNSILGLSETLLEQNRGPLNEKQEQALQVIMSSGQHLLGLINDVLEVSKIEAGKLDIHPDIVDINEICQSSLNFVKESALKKSITLEFRADPSISTLFADQQRLKQILVNLLSNAVKFTLERGKVTFDVSTNAERDQIRFSIADNGIGIAPEDLKKLFSPFVQLDSSLARQNEGTGLGLTIAYKLTELHGGSVQVESAVGKGSRFTIILPWNQTIKTKENISSGPGKMAKLAQAINEPEQMAEFHARILLAEDNDSNMIMLSEYLQDQGFEVLRAENGLEALAKAAETLPDLILMDIQMPEIDGLEATKHLRADPRFAATPIIALTALAMPGDRERCLEAGANEYLSKPVSLKKLLHTINEILDRQE